MFYPHCKGGPAMIQAHTHISGLTHKTHAIAHVFNTTTSQGKRSGWFLSDSMTALQPVCPPGG